MIARESQTVAYHKARIFDANEGMDVSNGLPEFAHQGHLATCMDWQIRYSPRFVAQVIGAKNSGNKDQNFFGE